MQNKNNIKQFRISKDLFKVLYWAFALRVLLLIVVINSSDPFIITDDRAYEEISRTYLQYATSFWDWSAIYSTGAHSYLQVFWPYAICLCSKILGTMYAGRIINVILSIFIIVQTYKLTFYITEKQECGMMAAKLMAYLPYPLVFSVFNVKDFYIMLGVIYAFKLFVAWYNGFKIEIYQLVISILLLIGVYWARGGVVEFVGIVSCFFIVSRFYEKKQYGYLCIISVLASITFFSLWNYIYGAFDKKIEDYGDTVLKANGLSLVQMHSPIELYKFPFQYIMAILSPMTQSFFGIFSEFSWNKFLTLSNVSLYPISFGCLIYFFKKKHFPLFYYSTLFVYVIITSMVLAIWRHYFFLFFLNVINFACFLDIATKREKRYVKGCSITLFCIILILSFNKF